MMTMTTTTTWPLRLHHSHVQHHHLFRQGWMILICLMMLVEQVLRDCLRRKVRPAKRQSVHRFRHPRPTCLFRHFQGQARRTVEA